MEDATADAPIWGFCYRCGRERPLTLGSGFRLASHAGRDGTQCNGTGRKAGYLCSPPDDETEPSK